MDTRAAPTRIVTATIPAGQSVSDAIDLSLGTAIFIFMPQDWTPALLSFQVSPDNVAFYDLVDDNAREVTLNITPGSAIRSPLMPAQVGWLRFRSGCRAGEINQQADRTITITATG